MYSVVYYLYLYSTNVKINELLIKKNNYKSKERNIPSKMCVTIKYKTNVIEHLGLSTVQTDLIYFLHDKSVLYTVDESYL